MEQNQAESHYPVDLTNLPETWAIVYVADVIEDIRNGFASGEHNEEGMGIPHLRPMNINRKGEIDLSDVKYVIPSNNIRVAAGDVLFNNTNSQELIGKTAPIIDTADWAFSNHMTRLRPPAEISHRFIAYQLHYLWMTGYFRYRSKQHVNQASISSQTLARTVPIVIPPCDEQLRIVAEVERHFSRLDAGEKGLRRTGENLKRLRARTLRTASEGHLVQTEAALAQAENRSYEHADSLLSQLLQERRAKWEAAQLYKMESHGKKPKNNKWKDKYVEPAAPDTNDLPDLPEGWTWATLDQLSWDSSYGISEKTDLGWQGTPVLRIPNISNGQVILENLKRTEEPLTINKKNALEPGDFLIIRTNGSKDLIGCAALVRISFNDLYFYASYLIRFRLAGEPILHEWIALQWNGERLRNSIESMASTTAGQYNIRLSSLKNLCLALPPLAEQSRIVSEAHRRLSIIDGLERMVTTNLSRANALREKILYEAFNGRLVAQNPSDEAAEKLLLRIKSKRPGLVSNKKKRHKERTNKPGETALVITGKERQMLFPFEIITNNKIQPSEPLRIKDMKIISLKVDGDYKSLHNFEQTFRTDGDSNTTLSPICLVGLNGSGKSNLIEALSEIFCYLEIINLPYERITQKAKQSDLRFEIEYDLLLKKAKKRRRIKIIKQDSGNPIFLETDGEKENIIEGAKSQLDILPTRIIGYSSGLNETISIPFFKTNSFYSEEVRNQARDEDKRRQPIAESRTLFMDYDSNAAILLANYLFSSKKQLLVFREHLRIRDVASFQIIIKLTYGSKKPVDLTEELKDSIARLKKCADVTDEDTKEDRITFSYNINPRTRKRFREHFVDAKTFFTVVYKLSLLNALALTGSERKFYRREDVKEGLLDRPPTVSKEDKIFNIAQLRLKLLKPEKEIDYAGISDGEHQFIHVFGTVKLFDEPGCLFLLDEPESHFNPRWRREFVQMLGDITSSGNQEFIISTHSPFIVSGCKKENVFKFERTGDSAISVGVDFETFGSSFDFLLMKLFDLKAMISEQAFEELRAVLRSNDLKKLEAAVGDFGESFEKRFLFERIAKVKSKSK